MDSNSVHLICRCVSCNKINHYDSMFCKECGIVLASKEYLCSECKEPIKTNDEMCYVCGKKIEFTEAPEADVGHICKEKKEEFINILREKCYGINFDFFEETLRLDLRNYPTVKLLLSDEAPEELLAFYEIEGVSREMEKFEALVKAFFSSSRTMPILTNKYANLVTSFAAHYWEQLQKIKFEMKKEMEKGMLLLIKLKDKFYEQIMMLPTDKQSAIQMYKDWVINKTLHLEIPFGSEDREVVRVTRAGMLFRIGEEMNNRGHHDEAEEECPEWDEEDLSISPESEHLYISSFSQNMRAVNELWSDEEIERANQILKVLSEKVSKYEGNIKSESSFEYIGSVMELMSDTLGELGYFTEINEPIIQGICYAFKLTAGLIYREDRIEKGHWPIVHAKSVFHKIIQPNIDRFIQKNIITDTFHIISSYNYDLIPDGSYQKKMEEMIKEIHSQLPKDQKKIFREQCEEGIRRYYQETKNEEAQKLIKEIVQKL